MIEAAQADPSRFLDLYERYFHRVYAYALRRTFNRTEAEDLTADVFHRALASLGSFEWRGAPFGAWLLRIAANQLADRWQRASREAGHPLTVPADHDDIERRAVLYELVERLPAPQRQVVEMRFGEGKSLVEVARALGRSEGAVKQLQRRALNALRAGLGGRP